LLPFDQFLEEVFSSSSDDDFLTDFVASKEKEKPDLELTGKITHILKTEDFKMAAASSPHHRELMTAAPKQMGMDLWDEASEEANNSSLFPDEGVPPPAGKRLAPVGANADDLENDLENDAEKLMMMENHREASANSYNHHRHHQLMQMRATSLEESTTSDFWKDPVGAAAVAAAGDGGFDGGAGVLSPASQSSSSAELESKIERLERDADDLNNSLMSMTSHFAKVQLRLQQVVSAPPDQREDLLMELQQFAFRAIPDVSKVPPPPEVAAPAATATTTTETSAFSASAASAETMEEESSLSSALIAQRKKHSELISQLKGQLEELEGYAYESGEGSMPSNVLLERQRLVMEQLKSRLNLDDLVDHIESKATGEEELKAEVEEAVGNLVNPLKAKSHLISQLKTQIEDLEMFIEFLQREASTLLPLAAKNGITTSCDCCEKHTSTTNKATGHKEKAPAAAATNRFRSRTRSEQEEIRQQTVGILERAMAVLQLTALAQFGSCAGGGGGASSAAAAASAKANSENHRNFYKNSLKKSGKRQQGGGCGGQSFR